MLLRVAMRLVSTRMLSIREQHAADSYFKHCTVSASNSVKQPDARYDDR